MLRFRWLEEMVGSRLYYCIRVLGCILSLIEGKPSFGYQCSLEMDQMDVSRD